MNNLQRLQMETEGINLSQDKLIVYLQENNINPHEEYKPSSATNKKGILSSALSVLESTANNPTALKSYKLDDMTVSQFGENLMKRIDQLERKIRGIKTDEQNGNSTFIMFN